MKRILLTLALGSVSVAMFGQIQKFRAETLLLMEWDDYQEEWVDDSYEDVSYQYSYNPDRDQIKIYSNETQTIDILSYDEVYEYDDGNMYEMTGEDQEGYEVLVFIYYYDNDDVNLSVFYLDDGVAYKIFGYWD